SHRFETYTVHTEHQAPFPPRRSSDLDDRIHIGHQGFETEEADAEAHQADTQKHRAVLIAVVGCQSAPQRIEHADAGVVDHDEDNHDHHIGQRVADVVNQTQHRHTRVPDDVEVREQDEGGHHQHRHVDKAAHK